MATSTNIVWLQQYQDESIPTELRPYVALFTSEDSCFQFLSSLPSTLRGLTLVVTDPTVDIDHFLQLKQISTIYLLSSAKKQFKPSPKIHGLFSDRQSIINQILIDVHRTKSSSPGFLTGVMAPFQGLYFILSHPSTWLRALVPSCIFIILFILLLIPGIWTMNLMTNYLFEKYSSRWIHGGLWLLRLLLYVLTICFSFVISMILAQPLSSPALESLVREQERQLKYPNRPEEAFCASIWRSIRVALVSIFLSIVIFLSLTLIELLLPPAILITTPLKIISTAFILGYDLIDYPLSLHFFGVRERTPWFRHHYCSTLGFGLAMEIIFLVPGGFLVLLPAGVCGATILVVKAERSKIDQPLLLVDDQP